MLKWIKVADEIGEVPIEMHVSGTTKYSQILLDSDLIKSESILERYYLHLCAWECLILFENLLAT